MRQEVKPMLNNMALAATVARSFNSAFKHYALYPAGHAFSQNYLARFKNDLDGFLKANKQLRLDISGNSFF